MIFHSYVTVYQRVNVRLGLDSLVQVSSPCRVHVKLRPGPCFEVRCHGRNHGRGLKWPIYDWLVLWWLGKPWETHGKTMGKW